MRHLPSLYQVPSGGASIGSPSQIRIHIEDASDPPPPGLNTSLNSNVIRPHQQNSYDFTFTPSSNAPDTHIRIEIFNPSGQKIKELANQTYPTSIAQTVTWDLKNESGDSVASDMYIFLIYTNNSLSEKFKVLLVK